MTQFFQQRLRLLQVLRIKLLGELVSSNLALTDSLGAQSYFTANHSGILARLPATR
jgi:hypothetical protein